MAALLRSKTVKFTSGSDADIVIDRYRAFFEEIAEGVTVLDFQAPITYQSRDRTYYESVCWDEDNMRTFSRALVGFSKCRKLMLGGHLFSTKTASILADGLIRMSALEEVDFQWSHRPGCDPVCDDVQEVLRNVLKAKCGLAIKCS